MYACEHVGGLGCKFEREGAFVMLMTTMTTMMMLIMVIIIMLKEREEENMMKGETEEYEKEILCNDLGMFLKDEDRLQVGLNYGRPLMPLVALTIMIFR